MEMRNLTDDEIRTRWKNRGLSEKSMILCLSQLESCDYKVMRDKVEELGLIGVGMYTNYKRNKSTEAEREHKPFDNFSGRKWGTDEIKEVFRMRNKGFTVKEISKTLERTPYAVKHLIQKYGEMM